MHYQHPEFLQFIFPETSTQSLNGNFQIITIQSSQMSARKKEAKKVKKYSFWRCQESCKVLHVSGK